MNILIIEDEVMVAEHLKQIVKGLGHHVVGIEYTEDSALEFIDGFQPDLVLLDIRLDKVKSGFRIAAVLNTKLIPFFFISAHADDENLIESSELKAEAFVVKPFNPIQIKAVLRVLEKRISTYTTIKRTIHIGKVTYHLDLSELIYLKADNIYTELHFVDKRMILRLSLTKTLDLLNSALITKVNRSYAINKNHISEETPKELTLSNGFKLKNNLRNKN